MSSTRSAEDFLDALAKPFYALAVLLVGIPCLDFIQSVGALQPGSVQWRFATVGLLSSVLLTPMLGLGLALVVAAVRGQVVLLRVLALVALLGGVLLLVLVAGFVLDTLQLKNQVPEQGQQAFRSASVKALLKHIAAAAVLGFMGIRTWRISAWRAPAVQRSAVPLVSR